MSGSFNHLIYDTGAYAADLRQSTAPLNWVLDPTYANSCQSCFVGDVGYIGKNGVSINTDRSLIDIESNLKLLNYRNTHNPALKYIPECAGQSSYSNNGYPCGGGISPEISNQSSLPTSDKYHYNECGTFTDYTRITNPSCTLRGTGVNRFQPMCLNFQDVNRWQNPAEVGISYRMVAKDNHHPRIPVPMNQANSLPDPKATMLPTPQPIVNRVPGLFTGALHEYYTGKSC